MPHQAPDQKELPSADEPVTLEGVVERIVYESAETGFFVGRLRNADNELVTFVGNVMAVSPGETIRIRGHWVEDRRFGHQVRANQYETVQPSSIEGIEKYLGSGLISGVGPTYAKRLVAAFGTETLKVIDSEPKRLREVPGIGRKRAKQIRESWEKQKSIQSIMVFLQGHGIGTGQAVRIYKRYGDRATAVLRSNPYRLAEDIAGIGFGTADKIAAGLGVARDAPQRLEAGVVYTLRRAADEGHIYLPDAELLERAARLLEAGEESLPSAIAAAERHGLAVRENGAVFPRGLYEAETGAAHHLKRLLKLPDDWPEIHVANAVRWAQSHYGIELSADQCTALEAALQNKAVVLTGGPGTGKTTLIRCLIGIAQRKNVTVLLAAPTGRAAKRMQEATEWNAQTIHRLLEFSPKLGQFTRHEGNPLNADLVIVDECSMLDTGLLDSLLRALPPPARLAMVGDVDQLPSVGPGMVLMDIIASGAVPVVRLNTIHRQAAESGIIENAHRFNTGQAPRYNDRDFFFIERSTPESARATVLELVADRIPKRFGFDPVREIQVLAPMHRGAAGVAELNASLQQALNPGGDTVGNRGFRTGDKVIQLRNNYELDVYNGDVGVVSAHDAESGSIHVRFDDRIVEYEPDAAGNLGLAYAITVHKSQGSEYPVVVLPVVPEHYLMLQRNVLYTAVTRARQLVVLVGNPKSLRAALGNTRITRRYTRLAERLRNEM